MRKRNAKPKTGGLRWQRRIPVHKSPSHHQSPEVGARRSAGLVSRNALSVANLAWNRFALQRRKVAAGFGVHFQADLPCSCTVSQQQLRTTIVSARISDSGAGPFGPSSQVTVSSIFRLPSEREEFSGRVRASRSILSFPIT
jgi:hypothetical protein